jgi:hypothetical protein
VSRLSGRTGWILQYEINIRRYRGSMERTVIWVKMDLSEG